MSKDVVAFIIESIGEMNYPTDGVDESTPLGSAGVDLESLAVAELAVRIEDKYGVRFADEESEQMAAMTVGEFADAVAQRAGLSAGQA